MAVLTANSHLLYRDLCPREQTAVNNSGCSISVYGVLNSLRPEELVGFSSALGNDRRRRRRREFKAGAFWQDLSKPDLIEMEEITGMEQLDQILQQAQERSQPIIIDWMAAWCRKCIYLKPKLEKLAAEYHRKITFYFVDVNNVPQALVKRGNISKMPTIQLWKDGEMKAEVMGGHKAWLVVDEVREMIQKHA